MIGLTRLILAVSATLVIYLIPSEPYRDVALTYSALVAYCFYSAAAYVLDLRRPPLLGRLPEWGHWIDVGWYTLLVTLSSGTNSIFFYGYFLPILVASFRWGFRSGMRVVCVSTLLFTTLGYATSLPEPELDLQRTAIRPIVLLTLGYMIAYWGGFEVQLKRRLELLKEVGTISNPRFGVGRTMGTIMSRLMSFFDADACLLVTVDPPSNVAGLRRVTRREPDEVPSTEPIPARIADLLLAPPPDHAVIYSSPVAVGWPPKRTVCRAFSVVGAQDIRARSDEKPKSESGPEVESGVESDRVFQVGSRTGTRGSKAESEDRLEVGSEAGREGHLAICEAIAAVLDVNSFMTVPFNFRNRTSGRLYITAASRHVFGETDARFLQQAVESVLPLVDNIRLVSQLAARAAEEERRKIALDIHDTVIQPYIGLRMGLASVLQKLSSRETDPSEDVKRLIEMTNLGIADLRRQVSALREGYEPERSLLPAVTTFAAQFSEATGISVDVQAETTLRVEDRLAAEAFQMVAEGLSNIRKHTHSARATVSLACLNGSLVLRIENDCAGQSIAAFVPRSIVERAAALGGVARAQTRENGTTVVSIEVPL